MTILKKTTMLFVACAAVCLAEIKLPTFFSDGMVLQQETAAKIWGVAGAGGNVEVDFAGQKLSSAVGADGKWMVNFKGLKASKSGAVLTVTSGADKVEIKDVLVGEVWLASGQSNMEWPVSKSSSAKTSMNANDPLLRIYVSINKSSAEPETDFIGSWTLTTPKTVARFTATGYEFAKKLREKLDVPVGIIECAWGGRSVQAFTSNEAIQALPEGKAVISEKVAAIAKYDPEKVRKAYEKKLKAWEEREEAWKKDKTLKRLRRPSLLENPVSSSRYHSTIYNGMIAPIVGYGARGVIWYQGESNANAGTAHDYGELLKCLILDWRKRWGQDLPFYYVQLANFERGGKNIPEWVIVQDEMRRLLDECEGVGMAVINDIGDRNDIHPKNKKDVALRLARWALKNDYGKSDVVVSGPLYASHALNGNMIEVSFSYGVGMKARDGKDLGGFELSDAEGKWHPAQASVSGDKVMVTSSSVAEPKNVRYAWKSDPAEANLVNAEGLPASCFIGK